MSAGLASRVTIIDPESVDALVADGLPILVSEIVLTGDNTVPIPAQYVFLNGDDLSTLFTVSIRSSSLLTIDVHFIAHRGLAVTAPIGGSATITHSQPGR